MVPSLAYGMLIAIGAIAGTTNSYNCTQACTRFLGLFDTTCENCVVYPQPSRNTCTFACSNMNVKKGNVKELSRICIACFADDNLLWHFCNKECKLGLLNNYTLCKACILSKTKI